MNIIKLCKEGEKLLRNISDNPKYEVEIILCELLNIERYKLYTENIPLSDDIKKKFFEIIEKRRERIPLQYILKKAYFFGNRFIVEKGIFIPRPETEFVVEETLKIYNRFFYPKKIKILDIGTGCGNIAISIAKIIKKCFVVGVDISKKSLKIAKLNASLNKTEHKTLFLYSNLFSNVKGKFHIIVSNPPYICKSDYDYLQEEVKKEPKRGLLGGNNGLKKIKKILTSAPNFLKKDGFMIIEIGYNQIETIKSFRLNSLKIFSIINDLSNIPRVVVFKKEKK